MPARALRMVPPSRLTELRVDVSRWPLVAVTYRGTPTNECLRAFVDEYRDKVLNRGMPFVVMFDFSAASVPTAEQRTMLADTLGRLTVDHRRWCKGEALISPSRWLRTALGVGAWFVRPSHPREVFADRERGRRWAQNLLSDRRSPR